MIGLTMRVQLQLRIVGDDGQVISEDEILRLDKGDDRLEAIGLSLDEAKGVLAGTQERLVTAQAASFLAGSGAAHCVPARCGARDGAGSCSGPRSAPSPWSVRAFTAAVANLRPAG